jgi:CheY-like chemotaxis protein/c-di-GMP-binding flagellar brake protein YcgR
MLSKGSILVVDDEINLCRILGAKLAKSGFSVVAVHDGQQAIDRVRETSFDIVLLDLILPKVDGLSALAEIRSLDNDLPVIVMTACESSEAMERARRHGVSAYVNKPFDLDNLVELVQTTSAGSTKRDGKRTQDSTVLFARSQPITIEILNGRISGPFNSIIYSRDDRTVSVLAPVCDGSAIHINPRTPVRVGLSANDAYYSFNSYVLGITSSEVPVIVLDKPGVIYRTQRRQSPRYAFKALVRYGKIDGEDSIPSDLLTGTSCDVSSGGIKILASSKLEQGDLVYLETEKPGVIGPVNAVAEVIRSRESDSDYEIAMRFRKITGNFNGLLTD